MNAIFYVILEISGEIFIFIYEVMINENGYSLTNHDNFYPEDASINTPKLYIVQMISIPIFTLLMFMNYHLKVKIIMILTINLHLFQEDKINILSNLIINLETNTNNENEEEDKKMKDEKYKNEITK